MNTNTVVECHPIGLLEVFENGETDHKVITTLPGEHFKAIDGALDSIRRFYEGTSIKSSKQIPGSKFKVGNFLSVDAVIEFIERSSKSNDTTS